MLENIKSLMEKTLSTNSKNEKVEILRNHDLQYLHYIFDYDMQYHVTSKNIKKNKDKFLCLKADKSLSFQDILSLLNTRKYTGNLAISLVLSFIDNNKEYEDVIYKVIDRDLKCGFDVSSINKAKPGTIKEFNVSLAKKFEERLLKGKKWSISEKKDGVRCICIIKNYEPTFYSRQGKEFFTLDKVAEDIKQFGIKDGILDGEMIIDNDFTKTMNEVKKKGHTVEKGKYCVFDMLDSFDDKRCFFDRYQKMRETIDFSEYVDILEQFPFEKFEQLKDLAEIEKWEGLMLRSDVPWKGKRTSDLLKYKLFSDAEFTVLDIEISDNGKNDGLIKSLIIDNKGVSINVGSGLSEEQRKLPKEYWVGKEITVQYFEETADGSLRFPTFKVVYDNGRNV